MRQKHWIAFLAVLTVIGFAWGFYQAAESRTARIMVENDRERAFYDLLGSVENLSVLSDKALIVSGNAETARIFSQLNREAYVAQESLSLLPVNHGAFSRTEQFLNQMGDFSNSLLVQASKGTKISDKQRETLTSLRDEINSISADLHTLADSGENPFSWAAIRNNEVDEVEDAARAGIANSSFSKIDSQLQEIPTLIYDGPFSDHLESRGPVKLPGKEIDWPKAKRIAADLLGEAYNYKEYGKSGETAAIPVLTLEVSPKEKGGETFYLDISRTGGFPVLMTAGSAMGESKLSHQNALTKAKAFLDKTPYQSMEANYSIMENNVMTINYVYVENDTLVYPDMVKISIDMNSGRVVGFDAQNYLVYHKDRDYSGLKISAEEAKSKLPTGLSLEHTRKAIIPKDNGDEVLCYEFRMKSGTKIISFISMPEPGKKKISLASITVPTEPSLCNQGILIPIPSKMYRVSGDHRRLPGKRAACHRRPFSRLKPKPPRGNLGAGAAEQGPNAASRHMAACVFYERGFLHRF